MNKTKKIFTKLNLVLISIVLVSCKNNQKELNLDVIKEEHRLSFNYLWEAANTNKESNGYGLVRDRYPGNPSLSSVAAVGFALAAIPAAVENGWISYEEGFERVDGTLDTLLKLERTEGFYYHFVNISTGLRSPGSEVSIIDTGLMLAGAIVAGEYFEGEVLDKVNEIYDDINWNFYINPNTNMFYMGYSPEHGFSGAWDHVSEQLILYVLAAGSKTYPTDRSMYYKMKDISNRSYTYHNQETDESFIYTYNGSLFQYQFSHAFVDFRNMVDLDLTNWFENSILATKAHYNYVIEESHKYKTYSENSWGLSAGDGPTGYLAFGGGPAKNNVHNGTITPYAALASINYLEKEAVNAANHYKEIEELWGEYGFKDSYNLGPNDDSYNPIIASVTPWYASDYIGIDKGITFLMIENYFSKIIWNNFMKNENVINGLEVLGFN